MKGAIQSVVPPSETNDYVFLGYPTDNFGLGTVYRDQAKSDTFIDDGVHLLGLSLPPPTNSDALQSWLTLGDFASVGVGGAISLSDEERSSINTKLVLPEIANLLSVSGGVSFNNGTTTTLTIDRAYKRLLRKTPFVAKMNSKPATDLARQAFDAGRLVIVVGDVVIPAMTVTVKVDRTTNPVLDAKLNEAAGKIIGSGAELHLDVTTTSVGEYRLTVSRPVVVATLAVKQPAAGGLAADQEWENWTRVHLDDARAKGEK
jgi:hypothetical protein